jgi:peroxiredoxin
MQNGETEAIPGSLTRKTPARRWTGVAVAAIGLGLIAAATWRFGYRPTAANPEDDNPAIAGRWTFPPPVGHKTDNPILLGFQRDWGKPGGDDRAIAPGAWKARMTALCALAKLGPAAIPVLRDALDDADDEVRDLAAQASGYFGDRSLLDRLDKTIREDPSATVRIYATIARGAIAGDLPVTLAQDIRRHDPHFMVRARLDLTLARGTPGNEIATRDLLAHYDLAQMDTARIGGTAPDFELTDLNGTPCRLADFRGKKSVVLVFVYGVTCMVCTGQVSNLRSQIGEFEALGAQVLVVEANEPYRVRATAQGASIPVKGDPRIPILHDSAHTAAATYGVAMQMNHIEWLNRPATFLIDRDGIIRDAFVATAPDDRPSPTVLLKKVRAFGDKLAATQPATVDSLHQRLKGEPGYTRTNRVRLTPGSRAGLASLRSDSSP